MLEREIANKNGVRCMESYGRTCHERNMCSQRLPTAFVLKFSSAAADTYKLTRMVDSCFLFLPTLRYLSLSGKV
jgi:hypothetical protein